MYLLLLCLCICLGMHMLKCSFTKAGTAKRLYLSVIRFVVKYASPVWHNTLQQFF